VAVGWAVGSGSAFARASLRRIGTMRAYVSARQCGPCLVLSKETRATTTGRCVDGAMGTSVGAGLATKWEVLPRPGRGSRVPAGVGQMLASEHGRPLKAQLGNIVQGSVERTFAWLGRNRRLSKDYERLCETTETWIYLAMTRLMLRRLAAA
jgi:hypothetical protein